MIKSREIKGTVLLLFIVQSTNVWRPVAEKHEVMISTDWIRLAQDMDYLAKTVIIPEILQTR